MESKERQPEEPGRELLELCRYLEERLDLTRASAASILHDRLGQQLTALRFGLSYIASLDPVKDQGEIHTILEEMRASAGEASQTLKDLLSRLSLPFVDRHNVVAKLSSRCEEWSRKGGVSIETHLPSRETGISDEAAFGLYRAFDGLIGYLLELPETERLCVILAVEETGLELLVKAPGVTSIISNGTSLPPLLIRCRERIRSIGGDFSLESGSKETAFSIRLYGDDPG